MDQLSSNPVPTPASASASASVSMPMPVEQGQKLPNRSRQRGNGNRAQPWRGHWPPKNNEGLEASYGFKKGETVRIYGN